MRYIEAVTDRLIWITLLVKLGVVASVASILARVVTFRRLFFAEHRTPRQTLALLAFFLVPLTLGVWLRFWVPNFLAADISFETVILLGLLLGPDWAMLGGVVLSAPAVFHHEYLALPFNVALGLAAGILGRFVEPEEVWSFTPFIDLSLYRWVRRNLRQPRVDRQILLLFLIAVMESDPRLGCARLSASAVCAAGLADLGAGVGVAQRAHRCGHCAEGVERAAPRDEARRTEAAAAGGAARRAAAADQSALSVQHAQLHCLAGAHEAGAGAAR